MDGIKVDFEAVKVEIDADDEELLHQWSDEETAELMTTSNQTDEDQFEENFNESNPINNKVCIKSDTKKSIPTTITTSHHQPRILHHLKCSKCFIRFSNRNQLSNHMVNCTVSPEASLLCESSSSSESSEQQIIIVSGDHGNMKFDVSEDVGKKVKIVVQTIEYQNDSPPKKRKIEKPKKPPARVHTCPTCPGLSFPSESKLRAHLKDYHIAGCFVCECGEKFVHFGYYRYHKKKLHNEEIDEEIVKSHQEMKKKEYRELQIIREREKKERAGPKKRKSRCNFFCDFPGCNFGFEKAEVLEKHKKAHRNETTVYNCPVCSRPCPTKNALGIHMAKIHPDNSARYPCRTKYRVYLPDGQKAMKRCKASFASKAELTVHKRIHREQNKTKNKKEQKKVEKEQKNEAAINSDENDSSDHMEEGQSSTTTNNSQIELKGNNSNNVSTASKSDNNNTNDNNNAIPGPAPVKKKPFPCLASNCTKTFATSRTRVNHMEIHHGIKY